MACHPLYPSEKYYAQGRQKETKQPHGTLRPLLISPAPDPKTLFPPFDPTPSPSPSPSSANSTASHYPAMECPTFGPADAPLALRVQSLDRKGDFKDKNKVLKVTPCRRTRSIANLKFFDAPKPKKAAPPVPPLPASFVPAAPAPRPPPRFLELFNPPDLNDVPAATHSGASTPFSEESRSQPATPPSPRVQLMPSNSKLARSYFAYIPHMNPLPIDGLPSSSLPTSQRDRTPTQWDHGSSSDNNEDEDNEDNDDNDSDYGTVQLDRLRQDWSSHAAAQRGLGMTDTFGRA